MIDTGGFVLTAPATAPPLAPLLDRLFDKAILTSLATSRCGRHCAEALIVKSKWQFNKLIFPICAKHFIIRQLRPDTHCL
ncbi:hypothetical protein [Paraburkholderia caribensis]|uniref:hypothetical protein n=1 Tax=Paraburkholderia caribensis TaxID=75105 RepID=UPI0011E0467B|nr:hypothetical protein [Paraburkholderia caribensis]